MDIRRKKTEKDLLINAIIDLEQAMFDKVQGMDGRASCQDDHQTFYIMRYSQHNAFGMDFLRQYREDLLSAHLMNRNLITEKYAYMMEKTEPIYFKQKLEGNLLPITQERMKYIQWIVDFFKEKQIEFARKYPYYTAQGRGLEEGGYATIDIYLEGELKTYSALSLKQMWKDLCDHEEENIVVKIQQTTIEFYGCSDLMEQERFLARKQK